jgi:hypothetical protein
MKIIQTCMLTLLTVLFLACGKPEQRITKTPSGKPEAVIDTNDTSKIKSTILAAVSNYGYMIDKDTQFLLEIYRPLRPREDLIMAITSSTLDGTRQMFISYTFIPGKSSTRVIATTILRARLGGGTLKSINVDNTRLYNEVQRHLFDVKASSEQTGSTK